MNVYDIDTLMQLSVAFTDVSGAPLDPTVVNLYLLDPNGNSTEVTGGSISRDGTGLYHYGLTPQAYVPSGETSIGVWSYKWQGTGDAEVTSRDTYFRVRQTQFENAAP